MSHLNKIQLLYFIVSPPDQVAEGDRIFKNHLSWMESTHHRSGDKALLTYNVSKAPELSNPFDSNSAPTGNTCFILNEIYETEAGITDHFKRSQEEWSEFPALLKWLEKCKVTGTPAAKVFNSLW